MIKLPEVIDSDLAANVIDRDVVCLACRNRPLIWLDAHVLRIPKQSNNGMFCKDSERTWYGGRHEVPGPNISEIVI